MAAAGCVTICTAQSVWAFIQSWSDTAGVQYARQGRTCDNHSWPGIWPVDLCMRCPSRACSQSLKHVWHVQLDNWPVCIPAFTG